jgi:hypothetical protein
MFEKRITGALGVVLGLGLAVQPLGCAGEGDEGTSEAESEIGTTPVSEAELVGLYDPTNAYLKNPSIREWGGSPLLTGSYEYGSERYRVEYVLRPTGQPSQYFGTSSINVSYPWTTCSYPVQIQINARRDAAGNVNLFVEDATPGNLPIVLPLQRCPDHLSNTWRVHRDPYVKRGPSQVFSKMMDDLCDDISARIRVVEQGKRLAAGPMGDLPANIYSATGDWEALSTPGRDRKLKEAVRTLHRFVKDQATGAAQQTIATQLLAVWNQHHSTCRFEYKTSNGAAQPFKLNDVQGRLFQLSFDPYHCTEMRWGAYPNAVGEYSSCNTQGEAHVKRFNDEKSLRNIVDRLPAGTPTPIGTGPAEPEDIDVLALLNRLSATAPPIP